MASTPARRENVDDVGFVQALAGSLHARYGIDDRRIYAAGYSNGGQMVFRLAAEMPERLAAIAAIAANLPGGDDNACAPMGTPLPVLTMAGTADPISPYAGGEVTIFGFSPRGEVLSADDTAQTFVRLNGLASATDRRTLPHQPDPAIPRSSRRPMPRPGSRLSFSTRSSAAGTLSLPLSTATGGWWDLRRTTSTRRRSSGTSSPAARPDRAAGLPAGGHLVLAY